MYKIQPKTLFVGKSVKYLPTCHSTNDYCKEIANNKYIENGALVYTKYQTHGRGQRGNSWEAEEGKNITMSLYLEPKFLKAQDQFLLNMAISNGIFRALQCYLLADLTIKWPNDIYYKNLKIGGVLIENTIMNSNLSTSIIGVGLNINQQNFVNSGASSLKNILIKNDDFEIGSLIENLLENIENEYIKLESRELATLKKEYLSHLFRINEWHKFKMANHFFEGKITDVDTYGRLVIETETGNQLFGFKEVEFVI